jgi:hypothetical protein
MVRPLDGDNPLKDMIDLARGIPYKNSGRKSLHLLRPPNLNHGEIMTEAEETIIRRNPAGKLKYYKLRTCDDCGKIEEICKSSDAKICRSCSGRRNAGGKPLTLLQQESLRRERERALAEKASRAAYCKQCGKRCRGTKAQYCSKACMGKHKRVERTCKKCGKAFELLRSLLNTNASGNFCSRPCYHSFLCNTERKTGRGSMWHRIRRAAKEKTPFCVMCGRGEKLQIHHAIPFRFTFDNSESNLFPLCLKCHKKVEVITVELLHSVNNFEEAKVFLSGILNERRQIQLMKRGSHLCCAPSSP